jgi:ybbR family protein
MKEMITRNLGLKIFSIVIAAIVWMAVISISNPEVTRTKTVSLEVLNEDVIEMAGKTYDLGGVDTVNVSYKIRSRDEYNIKASDIKAYVDLSKIYDITNSVPITVEVVNNKDLFIENPVARPAAITVHIEDMQRKNFDLTTRVVGNPAEGYAVGDITLSPSSIYLSGPQNIIGGISSIGVEIGVEGANDKLTGKAKPVFFDANGNKLSITDPRLEFETTDINYEVKILKGKSLSIKFNVGGNVAEGYKFIGVQSNISSVLVAGDPNVLAELKTVEVPASVLDVSGATASKSIVIDVADYLPDNVHADGNTQVSVTLRVEAITKKNITIGLSDITLTGINNTLNYVLSPENITVGVSGLESGLSKISKADLNPSIDLTNLSIGEHNVNINFSLPSGYSVDSHTPCKIIVSKVPEETTSSAASSSAEESSSSIEVILPSSTEEKESTKSSTRESTRESSKESTKSSTRESTKESSRESTKNSTRESTKSSSIEESSTE